MSFKLLGLFTKKFCRVPEAFGIAMRMKGTLVL